MIALIILSCGHVYARLSIDVGKPNPLRALPFSVHVLGCIRKLTMHEPVDEPGSNISPWLLLTYPVISSLSDKL